jgi:hypothetical protein
MGNHCTFDLVELGRHYTEYQSIMDLWSGELSIPICDVSYEELVLDPASHVRRMLEWCGLPWDEGCLKFDQSARVVATASYQQVRRSLYTSSVGRWKHYIQHLRPLVESMGLDYGECVREAHQEHGTT